MAWLKPVHFRPSWGSVYLESWRLWLWTLRKTLWSRPAPQSSCACCPQHRGKTLSNRRPPSQTDKPLDKREKYLSIRTLGFLVISTLVCAVIVLLSFVSEVPYPSGWGTREAFFFGYVRVHKEGWGQKVFFFKRTAVPYLERRETRWVPLPNVVGGHVKFLSYCGRGHVKFPYLRWGGGAREFPLPEVGGGHLKFPYLRWVGDMWSWVRGTRWPSRSLCCTCEHSASWPTGKSPACSWCSYKSQLFSLKSWSQIFIWHPSICSLLDNLNLLPVRLVHSLS